MKEYLGKKVVLSTSQYVVCAGKLSDIPQEKTGDIILNEAWSTEDPQIVDKLTVPFGEIRNLKLYVDAHPYVSPYYTPSR